MKEWKTYKLSEIADIQTGPFGSQLHNNDYVDNGTPIVTVEHLGNRKFSTQNLPCVSDADKARLSKYILNEGDIVFSRVGSVDRCSYVSSDEDGWMFSGRCLRVRCNNMCNPLFLYYYFCKETIKQYIRSIAVGATMPSINTKLLSDLPITLPSIDVQDKAVQILSRLDDKIELNRQINDNLEQQAQALFKSWFVDFEPFKDGKFEESEIGLIPEGWCVGKAEDFYEINIGKTPPRKEHEWFTQDKSQNIWVSISDLGSDSRFLFDSSEYLTDKAIQKHNIVLVPENTVLLSFKLTIGRVGIAGTQLTTNEAIARFITNSINREYTYFLLKNFNYSKLGSTSSIATAVNSKIIKAMMVLMPNNECLLNFKKLVGPIIDGIKKNEEEILRLTELRDNLLPKLMSGELKINDLDC